jgi:hypothetical protein
MKLRLLPIIGIIVSGYLLGCGNNGRGSSNDTVPSDSLRLPFVPSTDGTISRDQMASWFACNRPLDSLSGRFTTILSATDTNPLDSVRVLFSRTQDTICAKNGLHGGYANYCWITEHLGSLKNRPLYDSLRIGR